MLPPATDTARRTAQTDPIVHGDVDLSVPNDGRHRSAKEIRREAIQGVLESPNSQYWRWSMGGMPTNVFELTPLVLSHACVRSWLIYTDERGRNKLICLNDWSMPLLLLLLFVSLNTILVSEMSEYETWESWIVMWYLLRSRCDNSEKVVWAWSSKKEGARSVSTTQLPHEYKVYCIVNDNMLRALCAINVEDDFSLKERMSNGCIILFIWFDLIWFIVVSKTKEFCHRRLKQKTALLLYCFDCSPRRCDSLLTGTPLVCVSINNNNHWEGRTEQSRPSWWMRIYDRVCRWSIF